MMKKMQEKLEEYYKDTSNMNVWEYRVEFFRWGSLTLSGSMDYFEFHDLEIYFKGVSYVSLPSGLDNFKLRLATPEERSSLLKLNCFDLDDREIFVFYCDDEFSFFKHCKYYVVAKSFDYKIGTVYYYKRENLQEGERIAPWVLEKEDNELE